MSIVSDDTMFEKVTKRKYTNGGRDIKEIEESFLWTDQQSYEEKVDFIYFVYKCFVTIVKPYEQVITEN